MSVKRANPGGKRLEVTMRDVMDGLEDTAIFMNYHAAAEVVEILSIESEGQHILRDAKIIPINQSISEDVLKHLTRPEMKISA